MKTKIYILSIIIFQLIITQSSFAQSYSFAYISNNSFIGNNSVKFATLTTSEDCFRINDFLHDLLKMKNDSNIYALSFKGDTALAAKIKMGDYPGAALFTQDETRHFYKIDTLYTKSDSTINGLACKRVEINYVQPFMDDKGKVFPYDTIRTVFFVSPAIAVKTPFSFSSDQLKGLVLKYTKYHPVYDVTSGKAVKSYQVTKISTTIENDIEIYEALFKLPAKIKYFANYDELLNNL